MYKKILLRGSAVLACSTFSLGTALTATAQSAVQTAAPTTAQTSAPSGVNLKAPPAPGPVGRAAVHLPGEPDEPAAGAWGYNPQTGKFKDPAMTPDTFGAMPFDGSLPYLDQNQYLKNTKVEAFYPWVASTGHSWQAIFDYHGHRYMYDYYRWIYKIYDITDPYHVTRIAEQELNSKDGTNEFGPFTVKYNKKLNKTIAVQCYETPRYGVIANKYLYPEQVKLIRERKMLRGFRIYEVTGPEWANWKVLSETSLDPYHSAQNAVQEGSGCLDVPAYFGDTYLFVAGAPDDTFANTEYKTYLYSGAQLAFDISDPTRPRRLSTWWVPGQRKGEEAAYGKNPRAGNKTSWMGARMPLFIPKPVEQGGKYGYAAMGGFGFDVVDISDPADMHSVAHLDMPVSVTGTEGDNIDATQVARTGIVYFSGYPMSEDCHEPYKDIYAIDVKEPTQPHIIGTLPRPTPPKDAPFTDFCQRRGSFGPKRSGYTMLQPGTPSQKYLPYAFYNAGMQMFDVSDPQHPTIAAYFVPKMIDIGDDNTRNEAGGAKMRQFGNPVHGIFVEWDRNLIWVFANHGFYAISSPLIGEPKVGLPEGEARN